MALNPQLVPGWGPRGTTAHFPAPYAGEYVCAARDHSRFVVVGPRRYNFSGTGSAFLTNYRLVFVLKKPTKDGIQSFEIPLLFISEEDVCQPIFGANHLKGICRPVDAPAGSSEKIKWKLVFTNGGMGTMVPLFYSCLEYIRTSSRRRRRDDIDGAEEAGGAHAPTEKVQAAEPPPASSPPSFLASAFVDPSDPTQIFLTQPTPPSTDSAPPPKFPIV